MQDAESLAEDESRRELAAAQSSLAVERQFGNARGANSSHLNGLIHHWQNQLKSKMAAIEKAEADIASLEAEIREAHGRLYPPRKRTTPLVETAANNTDSSRD